MNGVRVIKYLDERIVCLSSMHLTGIPLVPFDNLRTFSSIAAAELIVSDKTNQQGSS